MSVSRFNDDPNANRYAQPKQAVLDRVPHITAIEYAPDEIVEALLEKGRPDYQYGNEEP